MAARLHSRPQFFNDSSEPPAGLLLELCGVLYDDSGWRRWMLQLLSRMGVKTHYTAFYQVWEQDHFPQVCSGEQQYWHAMGDFLRSVGLRGGRIDEALAAGQSRRKQWEKSIRPLPGVAQTLRQLSAARVPLAIVAHASFDRATAVSKLKELGLLPHITGGITTTSDLGRAGQYATRFAIASAGLGLPLDRIAYVGCGQLPLEQAMRDNMKCLGFNTELNTLPCKVLNNFQELHSIASMAPQHRMAG